MDDGLRVFDIMVLPLVVGPWRRRVLVSLLPEWTLSILWTLSCLVACLLTSPALPLECGVPLLGACFLLLKALNFGSESLYSSCQLGDPTDV